MEGLLGALCIGGSLGVGFLLTAFIASRFVYISRPNEVLVFSGRQKKLSDGSTLGYRVIHGGMSFMWPVLEKVDRMALTTIPIEINVTNAYASGGIPLDVHAIANVKVSSDDNLIGNAIERFMGRDPAEIQRVAKESLEGHLRGVLARMTPEEVNEDRLKFAEELVTEAGEDFNRLGLALDTLKVQSVSDKVKYLDSIGRERLANVLAVAEVAESKAKADADEAQAHAYQEGQVANEQAETLILQRQNEYRRVKADLDARAQAEDERAEQAALEARSNAEQQLQEIRARLEKLRLQSDVVLPAEAEREAAQMRAKAAAAQIAADGEALAEVLRLMTATWIKAGPDAKDIFLIQQLETVLTTVTERVCALEIGEVNLLDGGDGNALPQHLAAMPAMVGAVLREFKTTTGVDITGIISKDGEEK